MKYLMTFILLLCMSCAPYRAQSRILDNEYKRVQAYELQVVDWINKKAEGCKPLKDEQHKICILSLVQSTNKVHDLVITAKTDIRKAAESTMALLNGEKGVIVIRTSTIENDIEKISKCITEELK